jgi:hypothetical protein
MRDLGLKAGVVALTLASAIASALYVESHLRSQAAPLHPAVVITSSGVRSSSEPPLTSTYVS